MVSHFRNSLSAGDGNSEDDEHRRTLTLLELRPLAIIGLSVPLFPWESRRQPEEALKRIKNKSTRKFYEHQNKVIDSLLAVDALLDTGIHASLIEEYGDDIGEETPRQRQSQPLTLFNPNNGSPDCEEGAPAAPGVNLHAERETSSQIVHFWVNLNMAANVLLLIGKLAVVLMTNSLSMLASLADSVLDLLSTIIIYLSSMYADRRDWKTKHLYPVGRNRLEPIGVLVFSVIMILSFVKIAQEALKALLFVPSDQLDYIVISLSSFLVIVGTIVIKGILWQLCKLVPSSSVQALSQDALTDCVFNFFSVLFPLLSHLLHKAKLDPLGALLLAIYVVWSWGETAMEHIDNLTGAACSPLERQQLLYLCIRFSERIKSVNALNAYHAGDRLMCEVDIMIDPTMAMRDAHDLAEALQYALETLPIVERAFVHIDYRRDNFSGHVN